MYNDLLKDLQLINSGALVAMIWIIQILHYPSFYFFDKNNFQQAMSFHQRRISYVVIPLMVAELVISLYLWIMRMDVINTLGLTCVFIIWASTFFIQVPIHKKLIRYDQNLIRDLIKWNFIRTFFWTLKLFLIGHDKIQG